MKKIKLLAFIAALATALGLYLFFQSVKKPLATPKTNVVVAAMNIAANTTITKDMVTTSAVPTEAVLPNAVRDSSLVVGSVLSENAVSGEQIISDRLVKAGEVGNGTLAYAVKPGMRAITIGVDNITGISGMIKPENTVDIIAQFQVQTQSATSSGTEGAVTAPLSKMLLQNIKVLAVDQVMSKSEKSGTASYSTITLEVTPQQAVELSFSAKSATLQAILRSPLDKKEVSVPHVTQKDLTAN